VIEDVIQAFRWPLEELAHFNKTRADDMIAGLLLVIEDGTYAGVAGWAALRARYPEEYAEAVRRARGEDEDETNYSEGEEHLRDRLSEEAERSR
jgi:hypothetical protein